MAALNCSVHACELGQRERTIAFQDLDRARTCGIFSTEISVRNTQKCRTSYIPSRVTRSIFSLYKLSSSTHIAVVRVFVLFAQSKIDATAKLKQNKKNTHRTSPVANTQRMYLKMKWLCFYSPLNCMQFNFIAHTLWPIQLKLFCTHQIKSLKCTGKQTNKPNKQQKQDSTQNCWCILLYAARAWNATSLFGYVQQISKASSN